MNVGEKENFPVHLFKCIHGSPIPGLLCHTGTENTGKVTKLDGLDAKRGKTHPSALGKIVTVCYS